MLLEKRESKKRGEERKKRKGGKKKREGREERRKERKRKGKEGESQKIKAKKNKIMGLLLPLLHWETTGSLDWRRPLLRAGGKSDGQGRRGAAKRALDHTQRGDDTHTYHATHRDNRDNRDTALSFLLSDTHPTMQLLRTVAETHRHGEGRRVRLQSTVRCRTRQEQCTRKNTH